MSSELRSSRRVRALPVLVLISLVATALAPASAAEGVLEGLVRDRGGAPVAGAVVTTRDDRIDRETPSGADGRFVLRGLESGRYRVEIRAAGFGALVLKDVPVRAARSIDLGVRLVAGGPDVERAFVATDSRAPGESGAVTAIGEVAPYVPLGRNVVALLDVAPGVSDGGHPSLADVNPSIAGASGLENAFRVAGVDLTGSGYGTLGPYSLQYGSLGVGLTGSFLGELAVRTGALDVADPGAGGGVIDATLPTGSNDLDLSLGAWLTPGELDGAYGMRLDSPNAANPVEAERREAALTVSGPLLRGRLFGFAAYNPVTVEETFELTSGDADRLYDLDGDGVATDAFAIGAPIVGGRVPAAVVRERTTDNYAGRLTWFVTPDQKLDIVAFGDPSSGEPGAQSPLFFLRALADPAGTPDLPARSVGLDWGGEQVALAWQATWGPRFFSELRLARRTSDFREDGPGTAFRAVFDPSTGARAGGIGSYELQTDEVDSWSFANTHVIGPVELRYGWQQQRAEWNEPAVYSGPSYTAWFPRLVSSGGLTGFGPACTDAGFAADGTPLDPDCYTGVPTTTGAALSFDGVGFNVDRTVLSPVDQPTTADERSAFVQARWSPLARVTLTAGLRWTEQELEGNGDVTLPIELVNGEPSGAGSSTLRAQRYAFDGELAPRLGVRWDVRDDGRHVLFAHWGRYVQPLPSSLAQSAFSRRVELQGERFVDSSFTLPLLDRLCPRDGDGDGVFESSLPCHAPSFVSGLSSTDTLVLDGSQRNSGSGLNGILDSYARLTGSERTDLPFVDEWLAGWAWRASDLVSLEARYVHRELGRAVENVQFASNEQLWNLFSGESGFDPTAFGDPFPGHGAAPFGTYVLANPGDNVSSTLFPAPVRDYDALEVIVGRAARGGWQAWANYRLARLEGNYEGWFRNDTNCPCTGLSALYDFPAVSAVDADDDGRFEAFVPSGLIAGQYAVGPLDTERRHTLNALAARRFGFGLDLGARLRVASGQPRDPLLAHPSYSSPGQIPGTDPRYWWAVIVDTDGSGTGDGTGFVVGDDAADGPGFVGDRSTDFDGDGALDTILSLRTGPRLYDYRPVDRDALGETGSVVALDLHGAWGLELRRGRSTLTFFVDVFNVLDRNGSLDNDDAFEIRPGVQNVDFMKATRFQPPRRVRLGLLLGW